MAARAGTDFAAVKKSSCFFNAWATLGRDLPRVDVPEQFNCAGDGLFGTERARK
jgi:hypothetical protein